MRFQYVVMTDDDLEEFSPDQRDSPMGDDFPILVVSRHTLTQNS